MLIPPIGASLFIQALVIVNVLAPNALDISPSAPATSDIQVPTLILTSPQEEAIAGQPNTSSVKRIIPKWDLILQSILFYPPEMNWSVPQGCGTACRFEIMYDGLALQCRDITSDDGTDLPTLSPSPLYTGNATVEFNGNYDPTISYTQNYSVPDQIQEPPGTVEARSGVYCQLRNATYMATFNFVNNTKQMSTTIKSYRKFDILGDDDRLAYSWNTWGIFNVFAAAFNGTYDPVRSEEAYYASPFIKGLFMVTRGMGPPPGTPPFAIAVPSLSEYMAGLFANLTLGLIPHRASMIPIPKFVETGISVWTYTPWKLWAVYGPTFLLDFSIILYSLHCTHLVKTEWTTCSRVIYLPREEKN